MQINEITAENFGIVQDEVRVQPSTGINLFAGINGSGKSTVMVKALLLLLFNHTDKKLEEYVNENASLKDGFSLSVDFEHGGTQYAIEYSFYKKGNTGHSDRKLYVGNPLPEKPQYLNSDAVEYLSEVLPPSLSKTGLVARQNETDVINIRPAERREHLKEIYDLDFDEEIESVNADLADIDNNELPTVEKQIYAIENKEYQFQELKQLPFSDSEKQTYEQAIEKLTAEINELVSKRERIQDKEKELKETNSRIDDVQKRIDDLKNKLSTYQSKKEETEKKLDNPDYSKVNRLREQLDDRSEYEKQKENLESELSSIKTQRIKSFDNEELDQLVQKREETKAQIQQEEKKLDLCQKGVCPTCERPFDSADQSKHENALQSLENDLSSIKEQVENLQAKRDEHERLREEVQQNRHIKKRLKDRLEDLQEQEQKERKRLESAIEEEANAIDERRKENQSRLAEYEEEIDYTMLSIQESSKEKRSLEQRKESLVADLEDSVDETSINKKSEQKQELQNEVSEYTRLKAQNEEIEQWNHHLKEQKEKDQALLEQYQKDRDAILSKRADYEEAKGILRKEFPSYVISEMVSTLEEGINDFIDEVYYKPLDVQISESKNAINITYGTQRKKDVVHLSGAEKQLVSLAYKNHLNQLMNLQTLFLDEADSNYTDENAERLYDIIGSMKDQYRQLFVISHNEQAKNKLTGEYGAAYFEFEDGNLVVAS